MIQLAEETSRVWLALRVLHQCQPCRGSNTLSSAQTLGGVQPDCSTTSRPQQHCDFRRMRDNGEQMLVWDEDGKKIFANGTLWGCHVSDISFGCNINDWAEMMGLLNTILEAPCEQDKWVWAIKVGNVSYIMAKEESGKAEWKTVESRSATLSSDWLPDAGFGRGRWSPPAAWSPERLFNVMLFKSVWRSATTADSTLCVRFMWRKLKHNRELLGIKPATLSLWVDSANLILTGLLKREWRHRIQTVAIRPSSSVDSTEVREFEAPHHHSNPEWWH